MAFDQPLAADRVDDFNLFSAFVRAPLWILGGVLGRQNEEDDTYPSRRLDDDNCDENNPPAVNGKSPCHKRVVSDYDLSSTSQSTNDCEGPLTTVSIDSNDSRHPPGLKRTKNLSWSDESGKSLVEYNDESTPHEPSPYSSVASSTSGTKPLKSSLRRSRSIRSEADTAGPLPDRTRYIPKMSAAKSSLIMPTRPFGNDTANSGMESPQLGYGFYTNLTPPTPEMYQSYQSSKYPKSNFGQPHTGASALSVSARSQQNQVFQNLQNNQAAMAPSWTSVPI
eukprot:CAMPEP_0176119300 /NCGR_PEP_ID=MMETSP0120_2-20121206/59981_1 /TAXON_ID=160619 /ORGANISM="Kryptoperidinium foliaceum, Strain CCMP 1326" /LENGTH=279 /DNA_ID=CAMNT_0017453695 /DNA_START=89 /DNA_END=928 /DNA_ORIENTATION=+